MVPPPLYLLLSMCGGLYGTWNLDSGLDVYQTILAFTGDNFETQAPVTQNSRRGLVSI